MPTGPQRIVPHLWFDKEAKVAAAFYASAFPRSRVDHVHTLRDTPSGDCDVVSFEVWGTRFMAISAGPLFKFNPSISFLVNFDPLFFGKGETAKAEARRALDEAWGKLSEGGKALMPLDRHPFSERYGWVEDRYGLSWQLILTDPEGEPRPPIMPSLLFTGAQYGKARAAVDHYLSVFRNAKAGTVMPYPAGMDPDQEGAVMFGEFMIEGQWLTAMDSARQHGFAFNEAVSLMVLCDSQAEIDHYWQLSAVPAAEQCGWLKDRFGVSWQVAPRSMEEMMRKGTREQIDRLTRAFLPMKKFDLAALQRAWEGGPAPGT